MLWTATNDEAGYSSPIAATLNGVRTILCFTRAGLVAADPATGTIRFQFPWRSRTNASVNAAAPVVAQNLIFVSASYNTGAVLLQANGNQVAKLWSSDDALSSHYASSVYKDGYVFGFHGRQEFGQSLRCMELKTGKVRWSVDGYGAGTVTLLGDRRRAPVCAQREDACSVLTYRPAGSGRAMNVSSLAQRLHPQDCLSGSHRSG